MTDNVNHPKHYKKGDFECIDVMKAVFGVEATQHFCVLNAFKYIYRSDHKGKKREDLQKAAWYLNEFHKMEETRNSDSENDERWEDDDETG